MIGPIECSCLDDEACWQIAELLHERLEALRADVDVAADVIWTVRELLRNSERYGGQGGVVEVKVESACRVVVSLPGPPFDSRAVATAAAAGTGEKKALGQAVGMLEVAGVEWEYGWAEENQITFSWRPRNA